MTGGCLEFEAVNKRYGQLVALSDFTHTFQPGLVHALMGKNGSGKSTLVKILAGAIQPTSGTVRIDGKEAPFTRRRCVRRRHRHRAPGAVACSRLSIGENIFLGRLPKSTRFGVSIVDWRKLHTDAERLLHEMGLDIDSRKQVASLSVGQQQVIEIVKAMSFDPIDPAARRADLGARDQRGQAALRARPPAAGARRHDDLHHPPHERTVRDRRHLRRAARRRAHRLDRDGERHAVPRSST